ncbi:MAG TPA: hypothetical protein VFL91_05805 [Thermomicrobiales bacterium]|nr:hypothetical protein [Thermomicrobiales bacterium]
MVADFAARLVGHPPPADEPPTDPVLAHLVRGRRRALRLIAREGQAVTHAGEGQ